MLLKDYFILSIKEKIYLNRTWLLSMFAIPVGDVVSKNVFHPQFLDGKWQFLKPDGEMEEIVGTEGRDHTENPLMMPKDLLVFAPGEFPNAPDGIETNYGTAIANLYVLVYPFLHVTYDHNWFKGVSRKVVDNVIGTMSTMRTGGTGVPGSKKPLPFPYFNDRFSNKALVKMVEPALREDQISVPEYMEMMKGIDFLVALNSIVLTTATPKTLSPSKRAIEKRKELSEKYKGRTHEPAIAALIAKEVVAIDREEMADDPSANYLLKDKQFTTVRMKMYTMQGGVPSLDDPTRVEFIERSLREGMRPEDIPASVNSSRSGSYDRGASTALGGAGVNEANRAYMNTSIKEEFCGTEAGLPIFVNRFNVSSLVGRTIVGKTERLTESDAAKYLGKRITLYAPATCNTPNGHYCERCMDRAVVESKLKLGSQIAASRSVYLKIFLAAFHVRELKTVRYVPEEVIL